MPYLADFALQKQPEHSLMVTISRAWYNGSYTMAAKPIKSLEMHYTMIQFLIKGFIHWIFEQPELGVFPVMELKAQIW